MEGQISDKTHIAKCEWQNPDAMSMDVHWKNLSNFLDVWNFQNNVRRKRKSFFKKDTRVVLKGLQFAKLGQSDIKTNNENNKL